MDETASGQAWRAATPKSRRFDPPLTARGKLQAQHAGTIIASRDITADTIFSSPLARTLSTAHEIALLLNASVTVVPGLASCAAAVAAVGIDRLELLSLDEMKVLCPRLSYIDHKAPFDFIGAVNYIADLSSHTIPALIVTHREGIRDLYGRRISVPYCSIAHFRRQPTQWELRHISDPESLPLGDYKHASSAVSTQALPSKRRRQEASTNIVDLLLDSVSSPVSTTSTVSSMQKK